MALLAGFRAASLGFVAAVRPFVPRPSRRLPGRHSIRAHLRSRGIHRSSAPGDQDHEPSPQEEKPNIDDDRFTRVLTRCVEVAADPAQPPILGSVFKAMAEEKSRRSFPPQRRSARPSPPSRKENREALKALDALDAPYRVARAAVLAVLPETVLPDAIESHRTDTDKLNAIERLLDLIDDPAGQPWADNLLQGEFGQKAPGAVKEINEAITAGKDRVTALTARAAAYEAYLAFKRVVRNACGPGSKEYRRIHLRASPGSAGKAEAGADATGGEPTPSGEPGAGNTVSTPAGGGAPEPAPSGQNDSPPA